MSGELSQLRGLIRDIPDFPSPGIVFKDITPLLLDPDGLDGAVAGLASQEGVEVVGMEAASVSYPAFADDVAALAR